MTSLAANIVLFATHEKVIHPFLRLRFVCIGHGRARITEAPLRHKCRTACHPGKASDYVSNRRSCDEVVVQVAMLSDEIAIAAMIVVQLSSKIESAVCDRVV